MEASDYFSWYSTLKNAGVPVPGFNFEHGAFNQGSWTATGRLKVDATNVECYDPANPRPSRRFSKKTLANLEAIEEALSRSHLVMGHAPYTGFILLIAEDGSIVVALSRGAIPRSVPLVRSIPLDSDSDDDFQDRGMQLGQLEHAKRMVFISSIVLPKIEETIGKSLDRTMRDERGIARRIRDVVARDLLDGGDVEAALALAHISLGPDQQIALKKDPDVWQPFASRKGSVKRVTLDSEERIVLTDSDATNHSPAAAPAAEATDGLIEPLTRTNLDGPLQDRLRAAREGAEGVPDILEGD
jgi:hypothetical protein